MTRYLISSLHHSKGSKGIAIDVTYTRCGGLIILPGSRMWTDCTDIKEAFTFPGHDTISHCQELDSLDILAENALEVVQSVCCHHAIPVSSLVGQARP